MISSSQPSRKNFIAGENCEMLIPEKEKLSLIFALNRKFETLFTQSLAKVLKTVLVKEQNNSTLSAEKQVVHSCQ